MCRRMFLAPPLSFWERTARAAWRAAQARAAPFLLLSARLAVDLAREDSAASVLRGRGPLALAAATAAIAADWTSGVGCVFARRISIDWST